MAKAVLTNEMMDNILLMYQKGIPQSSIAGIVGISDSTVSRIVLTYDAVEKGSQITNSLASSTNIIRWACEKLGKSYEAVMGLNPPQEDKPSDSSHVVQVDLIVEAIGKLEAAIDSIDKRLSAMQMTLQSFRQESLESTKKIVETINVNGDIATKEREKIGEKVEAIKMNTRSLRRNNG